jgi:4-oxalocrotonate tautomerase
MPLQRIDLVKGRSPGQRRAIADAVHRALVEATGVPEDDRFQIVAEHEPECFFFPPEFLDVEHRSPVFVQVTLSAGRTLEQKRRLYARMAELIAGAGVPSSDLIVNLVEAARDNWSFGNGEAHYAPGLTMA